MTRRGCDLQIPRMKGGDLSFKRCGKKGRYMADRKTWRCKNHA